MMHMGVPAFISAKQQDIAVLCRRTHAQRLDLFGSAVRADFRVADSDLDFLVSFQDLPPGAYADAFFELKEGLEALFERSVDLLTEPSMVNPYLRARIEDERKAIYVA